MTPSDGDRRMTTNCHLTARQSRPCPGSRVNSTIWLANAAQRLNTGAGQLGDPGAIRSLMADSGAP